MRKSILFIILIACCTHLLGGCTFEDRLKDLEQRVTTLEEEYRQANEDIVALQQIVSVLQEQNYVTDIAPVTDDMGRNGYKISFSKSEPVTTQSSLGVVTLPQTPSSSFSAPVSLACSPPTLWS